MIKRNSELESNEINDKEERVKTFLAGAIVAAVFALGLYFAYFHGPISNDISDWSSFGDYFNGFVSPLVAIATVLLLYRAYEQQKLELSEAKNALKAQVIQAKESAQREMLWKSAEEVYKEILSEFHKVREGNNLSDEEYIGNVVFSGPEDTINIVEAKFRIIYNPLIEELASYLREIDALTDNDSRSTDYFRRRVQKYFGPFAEEVTSRDLASALRKLNDKRL